MTGRYLLDTSILIALLADNVAVKDNLAIADEVFLPSIAIGELYYGAWKSGRTKENLVRVDQMVEENAILGCDSETARYYGEIKNALRIKGRPIPENDIWIASIAVQHNLTLVTRDAHFEEVVILKAATWS